MNLSFQLAERAAADRPIRIGLIGAGKFGTMFLSQLRLTRGMHLTALADLMPGRAKDRLTEIGWSAEQISAASIEAALQTGTSWIGEDQMLLVDHPEIEVIIEATGDPANGIRIAKAAIDAGKHIVMVNVEADALAGPLLAQKAREKGVVYSLAWGDQPALICEHIDWARSCGFDVVAAGKGTRYHPTYHTSTPDTVWDHLAKYLKIEQRSHINPKMFNSFIDGTKSGIEMTAVCNAMDLHPQANGLGFPPSSRFDVSEVCKPKADGGTLEKAGVTECISSISREDTEVPHNLVMGTYVVIGSDSTYSQTCFREYNCLPDSSGKYAALYRPTHMIGLELGLTVASAVLRGEPTGAARVFNSDVVATAKRRLTAGEVLDGEGGFTVWGKQCPAVTSLSEGYLPLGLAHNVALKSDIAEGAPVRWSDVAIDEAADEVLTRREMEATFGS